MPKSFLVKVPGKVMLSGEYAVLFGQKALAITVNRYLQVMVAPRYDNTLKIESDLWDFPLRIHPNKLSEKRGIVFQTLTYIQEKYTLPFVSLKITSDLKPHYGLGSSSALRLALLLGIKSYLQQKPLDEDDYLLIAKEAYILQKQDQKLASGYDVYTQIQSGLVSYQTQKNTPLCQKIAVNEDSFKGLHIFVGGKGASTKEMVKKTVDFIESSSLKDTLNKVSQNLWHSMHKHFTEKRFHKNFWQNLKEHRLVFSQLPFYPKALVSELEKIHGVDEHWSFKVTGAGGFDAILVFTQEEKAFEAIHTFFKKRGWFELNLSYLENKLSLEAL